MADKTVIDSINRPIQIDEGQWESLKSSIAAGMKEAVGEVVRVAGGSKGEDPASKKTNELLDAFSGEFKKQAGNASRSASFDSERLKKIEAELVQLNSQFYTEIKTLQDVMSDVASEMKKSTAPTTKATGDVDFSGILALQQQMITHLGDMDKNFKTVSDFIPSLQKLTQESSAAIGDIRNHALKTSGLYTSDIKSHDILREIKKAIEDCCVGGTTPKAASAPSAPSAPTTPNAAPAKGGKGPSAGPTQALATASTAAASAQNSLAGSVKENIRSGQIWDMATHNRISLLDNLSGHIGTAQRQFMGFGKEMDIVSGLTKGLVDEEVTFIKNTRAAAYELNGVTKDMKETQKAFTELGKTVAATGFNRSDFQSAYLKALKGGIRDQKQALAVTTAQLNTEKQLGLEAGSLGDQFQEWTLSGRMSNMQVAEMGRNMREVARSTGLTGENLTKAVGTANQFITQLRNAATLTASTAKNIMEVSANAQKLGIGEAISPFLKAMSSTNSLFRESSNEVKAFLFQAASQVGRVGDLMNGTVLRTKAGIKDMSTGMTIMLKKFGVESVDAIDTLSDEAKMKLNLQLKAAYGLELGEVKSAMDAFKESSKTLEDKLIDVRKTQQANLTMEEKIAAKEQERRLKTSKSFEMLTALDEAAKGAKDMNEALGQFGKRQKDFEGDLKAMGKSWGSAGGAARGALEEAIKGVNESLGNAGKTPLAIDSSEIEKALKDPAAFRELTGKLTKAEQEAATAQKAALDPMSKIEQGINELNETMRRFSSKSLQSYMNTAGVMGMLVPALGMQATQTGIGFAKWASLIDKKAGLAEMGEEARSNGLIGAMQRLLGRGGAPSQGGQTESATSPSGSSAAPSTTALKSPLSTAGGIVSVSDDKTHNLLADLIRCLCTKTRHQVEKRQKKALDDGRKKAKGGGGAATGGGGGGGGGAAPVAAGEKGMLDKIGSLSEMIPQLAAGAATLAAVGLALVGFGLVIVKLGQVVLGAMKLDMKTVMEIAGTMALIVAAGAAVALAAYMAIEPLSEMGRQLKEGEVAIDDMIAGAAFFAIAGPALVILSMAMLKLINTMSSLSGMGWQQALETAANMAAIIGAAAALGVVVKESIEPLSELGQLARQAGVIQNMAIGAGVLLIAAPLLALLAGAILKITGAIARFMGMDWKSALTTAGTIAAMIAGAGVIAMAVLGASASLAVLGTQAPYILSMSPVIIEGALALIVLAPVMTLLGAALLKMCDAILNGFGISPEMVFTTAAVMTIMSGAIAVLAANMIVMAFELAILGVMAPVIWGLQPEIWMGVGAFLLMIPPMLALAGAIMLLGSVFNGLGVTTGTIANIAATAVVIGLAVSILSVGMLGLAVGLMLLGVFAPAILLCRIPILMGVGAFLLLVSPLILLGVAVMLLGAAFDAMGVTAQRMFEIVGAATVLAVGVAALSVGLFVFAAGLAVLGIIAPVIYALLPEILMGIGAFLGMIPPMIVLGAAIALLGYALIDGFGLSAGRIYEIAAAGVALSAAIVVLGASMTVAVLGLAILGVIAPVIYALQPEIWAGVGAFVVLAAPMLALGAVLALFGAVLIDGFGLTAGRMTEIAMVFSVLMAAITYLSLTFIAASVGLVALGLFGVLAWILMGPIWAGVGGFVVLAAPMLALGGAIALFGSILIDGFGLTASRMSEIAGVFTSLMFTINYMAVAMIAQMVLLGVLGVLAIAMKSGVGLVLMGVFAFVVMMLPMLLLAMAISEFGRAIIDDIGLNSGRMEEIRNTFTDLMITINSLAIGLLVSVARLSVLGILSGVALTMTLLAYAGAWAFGVMLGPIAALANAIQEFGTYMIDNLGLTSGRMSEISSVMTSFFEAIPKIVEGVDKGASQMAGMAGMVLIAWAIAGLANIGIGAFETLAEPMLRLAYVVGDIGMEMTSAIRPEQADGMIKSMQALGDMTGMIQSMMDTYLPRMKYLARLAPIAFLLAMWSDLGVYSFGVMATPLVSFAEKVADVGYAIMDAIDPSSAKMMVESMKALGELSGEIANAMDVMTNRLGELVGGGWWVALPFKKINFALFMMGLWFPSIARLINWGIVEPIQKNFQDPNALQYAAKQAQAMATVLTSLPPVFDALTNGITPLTKGGWFFGKSPIQKINAMMPIFRDAFAGIAEFLNQGIVMPILVYFGNPRDLQVAAKSAEAMGKVISAVPPIIKKLADEIYPITEPSIWGKTKLEKALLVAKGDFASNFLSIAQFVDEGIVDPIFNSGLNPRDVNVAAKAMEGMAVMFTALPKAINAIVYEITPLSSAWGKGKSRMTKALEALGIEFRDNFKSIMDFVGTGIIDPIFDSGVNPRDVSVAAKAMTGLAEMLPAIPKVIQALNGPIGQLSQSGLRGGKSRIKKVLDKLSEDFKNDLGSVFKFIGEGILEPIFASGINPRDVQVAAKAMTGLAEMLPAIPAVVSGLGNNLAPLLNTTDWWGRAKPSAIKNAVEMGREFGEDFKNICLFLDNGIISPILENIGSPREVKMAADSLSGMSTIVSVLPVFIRMLGEQVGKIMNSRQGKVDMSNITTFALWFTNIAGLLTEGMVEPIMTQFPLAEKVTDAQQRLNGMQQVVGATVPFVEQLYTNIQGLIAKLNAGQIGNNEVTVFTGWFSNIASLLSFGLIWPIMNSFPATEAVKDAMGRLDGMAGIIDKTAPIIGGIADTMGDIDKIVASTGGGRWALEDKMYGFFQGLGDGIRWGILSPLITAMPTDEEMNETITRLQKLDSLFRAMADALEGVAAAAEGMSKVNVNASIEGMNAPDTGFVEAINTAYDSVMAKQSGTVNLGAFDPKILDDAAAQATTQASKMATAGEGAMAKMSSDIANALTLKNKGIEGSASGGGITDMVSQFAQQAQSQLGMGDSAALTDEIGKQSPQITQLQSSMRLAETYISDIKSLFDSSKKVIDDIRSTSEYMSMFGDLDMYEKMIGEKIASSKDFVPTVQRIAESIGKGFNFEGGKGLVETITGQQAKIAEMKDGLTITESYTKQLSEVFRLASSAVEQIKLTTDGLSNIEKIREVETNIKQKISSGNSFMMSVLRTVEAVATNFGSNEEMKTTLNTVQQKIQQANVTQQVLSESLKFIDTIKQLQQNVAQVGQAATGGAGGAATGTGGTGGAGGAATGTGGTGGAGGTALANAAGDKASVVGSAGGFMEQIAANVKICADALHEMCTEATTKGSLYVADHDLKKTTEKANDTLVDAQSTSSQTAISTMEQTNAALAKIGKIGGTAGDAKIPSSQTSPSTMEQTNAALVKTGRTSGTAGDAKIPSSQTSPSTMEQTNAALAKTGKIGGTAGDAKILSSQTSPSTMEQTNAAVERTNAVVAKMIRENHEKLLDPQTSPSTENKTNSHSKMMKGGWAIDGAKIESSQTSPSTMEQTNAALAKTQNATNGPMAAQVPGNVGPGSVGAGSVGAGSTDTPKPVQAQAERLMEIQAELQRRSRQDVVNQQSKMSVSKSYKRETTANSALDKVSSNYQATEGKDGKSLPSKAEAVALTRNKQMSVAADKQFKTQNNGIDVAANAALAKNIKEKDVLIRKAGGNENQKKDIMERFQMAQEGISIEKDMRKQQLAEQYGYVKETLGTEKNSYAERATQMVQSIDIQKDLNTERESIQRSGLRENRDAAIEQIKNSNVIQTRMGEVPTQQAADGLVEGQQRQMAGFQNNVQTGLKVASPIGMGPSVTEDQRQNYAAGIASKAVQARGLGTGVPGAGAPISLPGSRVGPSMPMPPQQAAYTQATETNMQTQVEQQQATNRPAAAAIMPDQKELQGSMDEEVITSKQILGVLVEMLRAMQPRQGQGGGGRGDTSSKLVPDSPASYYKMPCGDLNSAAGKGVTNMSRSR